MRAFQKSNGVQVKSNPVKIERRQLTDLADQINADWTIRFHQKKLKLLNYHGYWVSSCLRAYVIGCMIKHLSQCKLIVEKQYLMG